MITPRLALALTQLAEPGSLPLDGSKALAKHSWREIPPSRLNEQPSDHRAPSGMPIQAQHRERTDFHLPQTDREPNVQTSCHRLHDTRL